MRLAVPALVAGNSGRWKGSLAGGFASQPLSRLLHRRQKKNLSDLTLFSRKEPLGASQQGGGGDGGGGGEEEEGAAQLEERKGKYEK